MASKHVDKIITRNSNALKMAIKIITERLKINELPTKEKTIESISHDLLQVVFLSSKKINYPSLSNTDNNIISSDLHKCLLAQHEQIPLYYFQ